MRYFTKLRKSLPMRDISERYPDYLFEGMAETMRYEALVMAQYFQSPDYLKASAKWME